jgi:4-amino-4-deoxy-L-arabinose transferase-like glycosyltransferase
MRREMITKRAPLLVAVLTPAILFFLLPPLGKSGLWDPYEVATADAARGLGAMATSGPRLGVACVALGFRVFGLHDWAGRAPLAFVGLLGVLATYSAVARLVDRRAGLYAAIALSTMPLFFVHARTMLGDVVTMSASAAAFGGLAVIVFGRVRGASRAAFAAMALVGLGAGLASRGAIVGVAVPCLGVGAAWAVVATNGSAERDRAASAIAMTALAIGAIALALGWNALATASSGDVSALAGVVVRPPAHASPFDRVIAHVGHALLPWSALLPFAMGRLFVAPARGGEGHAERESALRVVILVGAPLAVAAHALLATRADLVPFSAPALFAAACAIAVRDFERGAHPSVAVAVGTLLLALVLGHDLTALPEKAYEAYGVAGAAFPEGFKATSSLVWTIAIALFVGAAILAWVEAEGERAPFDRARYVKLAKDLREAWGGRVATIYASSVVGAAALAAVIAVGGWMHARFVASMPAQLRVPLLNAWWLVAIAPIAIILGANLALDAVAWLTSQRAAGRVRRASIVIAGGAAAGVILCAGYYPALANQLSPKSVFARYERVHVAGEPLALLGISDRGAAYYGGAKVASLSDPPAAIDWLASPDLGRRFLIASASELPRLNALHRARAHANLPLLETSDHAVLAVSALAAGEASASPLDAIVLAAPPAPRHAIGANFDDRLVVLGFDLTDDRGAKIDAITAGRRAHLRTFYRVLAPIAVDYTVFVHIDGSGRRHNADHAVAQHRYPTSLWQKDDIVADDVEITLEPNFTPGAYHLYFGLYTGGGAGTRMDVKSGPSDGQDRVDGGILRVQ